MNFISKLLTIMVASTLLLATVFAEATTKEQVWVQQSYNHCWIKHTVAIEDGFEVDHWDKVCTIRTYWKPKTWR